MDEIKKVITIEVNGDKTVKDLKQEISDLRDALLNTEQGTEQYKTTLDKLIEDQKLLTQVMNAGRNEVTAATGSYNALCQEMSALKKVWKEVTDEASRNEIGARILDINTQLKDMDASIGNFQRNVGDYEGAIVDASKNIMQNLGNISPALGSLGGTINQMIPIIQKTTKVATTGLKGVKKAIVSTGIGALIAALGLLVANWEKVADAISKVIPWMRRTQEETNKQIEANNQLVESNKALTDEMDFQARIMAAQGKSTLEIIKYKKQETEALLANTEAQIEETNAKIAAIKAHSAFGRWIRGERKPLKELEESLQSLIKEQEALSKSVKKFGQDIVVEETKLQYDRTKAASKGSDERISIEKYEADSKLDIYKDYIKQAKALEESFYDDEKKLAKEYADNQETTIKGLYASLLDAVKSSNVADEISKIGKMIESVDLPSTVKEQIDKAFKGLDLTKSGEDITNQLRQALGNIDLTGVDKTVQDKFRKLINTIEVKELSDDLDNKLNAAFSNVNFEDVVVDLKAIFGDDPEFDDIIKRFEELWKNIRKKNEEAQKQLHTDRVKENAETLEDIRKQEEDNAIALINLQLREANAARGDKPKDRIAQMKDEMVAENLIFAERKKSLEGYIKTYEAIAADENVTDDERKKAKEIAAQKQIELSNLIRDNEVNNSVKMKEIRDEEKEQLQDMISGISDFANKIGDILGSVADYWMDYVQSQVDAGKMSEKEGEKQFKWIKALQIAQTTIQTIAAAMAAFNGIISSTGGWGAAAAAAEMAAVLATGAVQIAKIKNTHLKKNSDSSTPVQQGAQVRSINSDYNPQYVAASTGQSETDNLRNTIQSQPIWVSVQDINSSQRKVAVKEIESTF